MPLFIDLHVVNNFTLDQIKKYHVADKVTQAKYGVRYLQILLNQPQGHLFCLVEGPDKETCAKVHQEAHGNIACNILEITDIDFMALLGNKQKNEFDFTLNQDGTIDNGSRTLLSINLFGSPSHYRISKEIIKAVFQQNGGQTTNNFGVRPMIGVFDSCTNAIIAGILIKNELKGLPLELRMGINLGPPLTEKGNFFEHTQKSADRFSFFSQNGQLTLPSKVLQLCTGDVENLTDAIKVISLPDEKFMDQVMNCMEVMWNRNDITTEDFAREIGMSKSQLTRRLNSLSGLSPNEFCKEYRLRKSIALIESQDMNIGEVTMALGFTNPSYFAKCFKERFGKSPSEYMIDSATKA